jgi:nitrogen fixation-related uncharacterized protein
MLFIIIAILALFLGLFFFLWSFIASSKQMTNEFHFDPDEYGLREHQEVNE